MASTQKLPSGKWSCRVYVGMKDGKRVYKRMTAETKKEAERMAHQYALDHPLHKNVADITVKEAMESYIVAKSNILSPATIAGYERIVKNRFLDISNCKISELEAKDYQASVNKESAFLSPKTIANAVGLLCAALEQHNKKITLSVPQKKKQEIVIPTDAELKLLCDEADLRGIGLHVRLAAYMGLRRSEIAALDLENDVNLKKKTLRIYKAVVKDRNNDYVTKTTKTTSSTRQIPIPSVVMPSIIAAMENGDYHLTPGAIEGRFIKMKKKIGLDHITFHSLRHYFASTLIVMDVPDFYAMKLMGHSSDLMLKNVYQHVRQEYMDEITEKMDNFFSKKRTLMTD